MIKFRQLTENDKTSVLKLFAIMQVNKNQLIKAGRQARRQRNVVLNERKLAS